jgi:hypothetical protein
MRSIDIINGMKLILNVTGLTKLQYVINKSIPKILNYSNASILYINGNRLYQIKCISEEEA